MYFSILLRIKRWGWGGGIDRTSRATVSGTRAHLTGLSPATAYSVAVAAVTVAGAGVESAPVACTTMEGGECGARACVWCVMSGECGESVEYDVSGECGMWGVCGECVMRG